MSALSTIRVTRAKAVRMLQDALATAPDGDIAHLLNHFIEERLYNCYIVGEDEENDDDLL